MRIHTFWIGVPPENVIQRILSRHYHRDIVVGET